MEKIKQIEKLKQGLSTAFINQNISSNLAYKPQFVSNNYKEGRKVISSIEDELLSCEEFAISVAFVTMGGITPLLQTLRELEQRNIPGKILTTDYLTFSDPKALRILANFKNIELKMFVTENAKDGFHTKGYIFKKEEMYRIIVGSSNMTLSALTTNREWNDRNYKQIHTSSQEKDLRINVFSMCDFKKVLESISIPYDIVLYLEMCSAFFESTFPDLFINNINETMTSLAKIENEDGLLDYYIAMKNGNKFIDDNALEGFRFIIKSFQERLLDGELYNKKEYKETLKYLLKSNRNTIQDFMLRWQMCVEHCMKKEETMHHFLIDTGNEVGYLYITETSIIEEYEYIKFILQLFKYKFKLGTVVGVLFNMINNEDYTVEWILISSENVYDEQFERILEEENPWSNIKQLQIY